MDNALRHGISSSPNSAQGTDSRHGTPETKLTAFSPEDLRTDQKPTNRITLRSDLPPVFSLSAVPAKASPKGKASHSDVSPQQHDPFVTTKAELTAYSTSEPPKLSPTASAFTPMGFRDYKPGNIISHTLIVPSNTSDGATDTHANASRLSPLSAPITSSGHLSLQRCLSSTTTTSSSSVTSQPMSIPSQKPFFSGDEPFPFQFSSTNGLSRALIISQVDRDVSNREFIELFKFRSEWNVQYLRNLPNGMELASHASRHLHGPSGDGEVVVKADFLGPCQNFDAPNISRLIIDLLGNYGDIMAYEPSSMCPPTIVYRAEFYDTRAADRAIAHLNGFKIAGCTLGVYNNNPGIPLHEHQRGNDGGSPNSGQEDMALESKFRKISIGSHLEPLGADFQSPGAPSAEYATIQHSPTSLNGGFVGMAPSALEKGSMWNPRYFTYPSGMHTTSWTGRELETRGDRSSGPQLGGNMFARSQSELCHFNISMGKYLGRHNSRDFNAVPHNTVDIERIRIGTDVRTTVRPCCHRNLDTELTIMVDNVTKHSKQDRSGENRFLDLD
ncbi:MAG: hypothetical protein Q9167_001762 [Letrouitia subvulpina]